MIKNLLTLGYGRDSRERHAILKSFVQNEVLMNRTDKEHLYELGMIFFDGIVQTHDGYTFIDNHNENNPNEYIVIEKDYSRAYKYFTKAADMNHSKALLRLGIMYHCGYGVGQDDEQGEVYFIDATNKDIKLLEHIGLLYHTHKDIQNFILVFEWYKRLDKGIYEEIDAYTRRIMVVKAQSGLGLLYEYGDAVEKNYQMAIEYDKDLASSNFSIGVHHLALMYYHGKGVSVDYKISFNLFKETIDAMGYATELPFVYGQNNPNRSDSQNNFVYGAINDTELKGESYYYLRLMYKNGQGIPQDKEKS